MKFLIRISLMLFVSALWAQENSRVQQANDGALLRAASATQSQYGSAAIFINPKRNVEGSVYLFPEWENYVAIVTSDNQKFSLKNINLNIEQNVFQSKFSRDSLFTFSFNNIDRFVINNKVFKNYFYDNDNRVFEIIYESDGFSLMKGYRVQLIEGSVNPMVNRKNNKLVQKYTYYVKRSDNISTFKFSKKKILGLVSSDRVKKIEQYAKDNKLSYKKPYDVQRMLTYSEEN